MDAFEQLVSEILWWEGYWVRTSVKVELTTKEKRQINRPSSPRWELDIVAYSGHSNLLRVVECKSFFDSPGVKISGFDDRSPDEAKRYKLFNDPELRRVVFKRLCQQLVEAGACLANPKVRLSLAAGKIRNDADRDAIHKLFKKQDWDLWDEPWLREKLKLMAQKGYENQVSSVVAKLLLRGKVE